MENSVEKKRNIRATLNGLEVGESDKFALALYNYDSVLTCRTRLQKSTGKKFSSETDETDVTITRTL